MSLERIRYLVDRYREQIARAPAGSSDGAHPAAAHASELLESMLLARHLDVAAHELRAAGVGHYTICSSGHEMNAVLGRLTRTTDPTMVHYRSAALQLERARQAKRPDPVLDIALSLVASSDDPVSRGRHKVFGGRSLGIIPQTSTIASHLPRAVGLGFALERRARLGLPARFPPDAIVMVSFGDASINHSTALGAFNAVSWTVHQRLPMPILFVCEDNGLGISVRSPPGWVETRLAALPHIEYFSADATDLRATWLAAEAAVAHVRLSRRPAVLHLHTVRLLGHAGSDADTAYRSPREIEETVARDPVLLATLDAIAAGWLKSEDALRLDAAAEARVRAAAREAVERPTLTTRAQVAAPLFYPDADAVASSERFEPTETGHTLAQGINAGLAEALDRYPEAVLFGEDVAKKGGVYGVTKGLLDHGGPLRVFNTLLDEQTILGLALGAASAGLLPIPEIQYLAYLHNAEDQLRGEAATLRFFSDGAFDNPLVLRIAGLAYQKGFGGHFHNDNSLAVLRDIPGIAVAVPARADDARALMRTAISLATVHRRPIVIVEPIALYHTRDLHDDGDGLWLARDEGFAARFGEVRVYDPSARDAVIVTYGNGARIALRAAKRLRDQHGIECRVLDVRWIVPLPTASIVAHAAECGRLVILDECRRSGNVSEAIITAVAESRKRVQFERVTAEDSLVPLGNAANLVLPNEDDVENAVLRLLAE